MPGGWEGGRGEAAAKKQARIDRGEDVIVGVNKFQIDEQDAVDILEIDNEQVRDSQLARLASIRETRDDAAVEAALNVLTQAAEVGEGNLLGLAVEATRCRATVGEISDALETVYGRFVANAQTYRGCMVRRMQKMPTGRASLWILSPLWSSTVAGLACWSPRWGRTVTIAVPR